MPLEADAPDDRSESSRATDAGEYGTQRSIDSRSTSLDVPDDLEAPPLRSALRIDVTPLSSDEEDDCEEVENYYTKKVMEITVLRLILSILYEGILLIGTRVEGDDIVEFTAFFLLRVLFYIFVFYTGYQGVRSRNELFCCLHGTLNVHYMLSILQACWFAALLVVAIVLLSYITFAFSLLFCAVNVVAAKRTYKWLLYVRGQPRTTGTLASIDAVTARAESMPPA